MGMIKRMLGYATLGAAKESARRTWESRDYIESGITAAQTGVLMEAARNLFEGEFDHEEEPDPNPR